jgi:hypothetical protein
MQTDGYMIVLKPGALRERYLQFISDKRTPAYADYIRQLRTAFSGVDPKRYRGISRAPLMAFPCLDEKVIEEFQTTGCEMRSNAKARYRFRQLIGDVEANYNAGVDEDLLSSQTDAEQVLDLLDDRGLWEIIHLSRGCLASSLSTLGFDIGYWGGDHFSLIADTIVAPTWHPPDPEDFDGLKEALAQLNANLLFDSPHEAETYRAYYKSRRWAETEAHEGEFCLIRVEVVE